MAKGARVLSSVTRKAKANKRAVPKIKANRPKRGKRVVKAKRTYASPPAPSPPIIEYDGPIPKGATPNRPVVNPTAGKGGGTYSGGRSTRNGYDKAPPAPKRVVMKNPRDLEVAPTPIDYTSVPVTPEAIQVKDVKSNPSFYQGEPRIGRHGIDTPTLYGGSSVLDRRNARIKNQNRKEAMNEFIGINGRGTKETGGYVHYTQSAPTPSGITNNTSREMDVARGVKINIGKNFSSGGARTRHSDFEFTTGKKKWTHGDKLDFTPTPQDTTSDFLSSGRSSFEKLKDRYEELSKNQKIGLIAGTAGAVGAVGAVGLTANAMAKKRRNNI